LIDKKTPFFWKKDFLVSLIELFSIQHEFR